MVRSKWRGHSIVNIGNDVWIYNDTKEKVSENPNRKCGHCNLENRDDDCDSCLGKLPGVSNACCGHGSPSDSYIQFENGLYVQNFIIENREQ